MTFLAIPICVVLGVIVLADTFPAFTVITPVITGKGFNFRNAYAVTVPIQAITDCTLVDTVPVITVEAIILYVHFPNRFQSTADPTLIQTYYPEKIQINFFYLKNSVTKKIFL